MTTVTRGRSPADDAASVLPRPGDDLPTPPPPGADAREGSVCFAWRTTPPVEYPPFTYDHRGVGVRQGLALANAEWSLRYHGYGLTLLAAYILDSDRTWVRVQMTCEEETC